MHVGRNRNRCLALAHSVSEGGPIDWPDAEQNAENREEAGVIRALRLIDGIARIHSSVASQPASHGNRRADVGRPAPDGLRTWRHLKVLEPIGRGAFGTVYRARDEALDCDVALKLLWPNSTASVVGATGRNEARLLARIHHPNVVHVYGVDHADGRVGVWMEHIKGRTLSDLLASNGPFGAREAAAIGLDLCSALAAVHQLGLVHRDVKAGNVMREEGGRIVLMDFGAGIDVARHSAGACDQAGTPLYLAPELFDGAPATPAADIYSLGVLLYHLVSGSYPVEGTTREEIERSHAQGAHKPLRDWRPDLPEPFVRIVERAVARHPHDRFPTAGACADALGSALGFSPLTSVHASDAHAPARTRWPVAVFLLSVAAAASIATSALVSWRVSAKTFETAAVSGVRLQCR